jgi:hypothetical protein
MISHPERDILDRLSIMSFRASLLIDVLVMILRRALVADDPLRTNIAAVRGRSYVIDGLKRSLFRSPSPVISGAWWDSSR